MSTQGNIDEVNEESETINEYSKTNWNNIPSSSSHSCTSGHYPTSDPVKAPGSDGSEFNITFSVQTTNPPSNSGCITKTLKPGGKLSHKITLQSNDDGGQSSKPLPKERKRKYNREGPALPDEKEEAKRQKAITAALWREKNIGIRKENIVQENTTVEINIERSLSTSDPVQRSEGIQMVLEERKKKILLLEDFKKYVVNEIKSLSEIGKQYYVEQHQPEQENRHFEKEMTWEKIDQGLELQTELENQKEKEGLTHKLEQSELENKQLKEEKEGLTHKQEQIELENQKEKEGLTHKLEQRELENKKLKEERGGLTHKLEQSELENKQLKEKNKDLMKKQVECYAGYYNLEHFLQTYFKQE